MATCVLRRAGAASAACLVRLAILLFSAAAAGPAARSATLYGVNTSGNFIVGFDSEAPQTPTSFALISGLQLGERVAGVDFRPRTGQLYALGVTTGAIDTLRLYTLDPLSGVATAIPGATPFTASSGASYGMSFNPTVDRIRVVNVGNENLRINPNNGARADIPTNDTDLNPAGGQVACVAYDRPFESGLAVANRTTLFGLSVALGQRVTIGGINQSPSPNGGALMNAVAIGTAPTGDCGFDIARDGTAYAALTVGGVSSLFRIDTASGAATLIGAIGGGNLQIGSLAVLPQPLVAFGADVGSAPRVRVVDAASGEEIASLLAFDADQKGGVRVALGDVDVDGTPELFVAPGPAKGVPPDVRILDLAGAQLSAIPAFDAGFAGGIFVAAGDVNGDGAKDVIVGQGAGGEPRVRVFSGAGGALLVDLLAYDAGFKGGVQVAAADFDRDGDAEIVTAPGKGAAPAEIHVYDATGAPFTSAALPAFANVVAPYDAKFKKGVFVAAGDVSGDGVPDLVAGPGKGGTPEIVVLSGVDGSELARFAASNSKSGLRVAVADVDGDGRGDVLVTAGKSKPAQLHVFDGLSGEEKSALLAFDGGFKKGVFVGAAPP